MHGTELWKVKEPTLSVTSFDFENEQNTLLLYPNPASDSFQMNLKEPSSIAIYDSRGKQLFLKTDYQGEKITVAQFPIGFYIVSISANGYKEVKKLVVK